MDVHPGIRTVAYVATALACLSWLALPSGEVHAESAIEVNIGTLAPKGTPWMATFEKLEAQLEAESKGRLNVILRPPGVMGEVEMVKETLQGERLQGCGVTTAAIAEGGNVPQLSLLELPFLFRSNEETDHVLDNVLWQPMSDRLGQNGLVLGIWSENGWRSFATRGGAVRTPEDLKKYRMRAQESQVHVQTYKAFGVNAVQKPATDILAALQADEIDGLDNTALFIQSGGLAEGVDHFTLTRHIYQPAAVVFSKKWFDTLPGDLQKILLGSKALTQEGRAAIRAEEVAMVENLELMGMEVVELEPTELEAFATIARKTHATYAGTLEGGKELLDRINAALAEKRK